MAYDNRTPNDNPAISVIVYSYRPDGATKQRKFVVATGDRPLDVVSRHGTAKTAVRAGEKLAKKLGKPLVVEV